MNPYRIPSSTMEPTLHCARARRRAAAPSLSDRVLANRFIYHFTDPERGDVVVFKTPPAASRCEFGLGGGTFVKRIVGLPGERVRGQDGFVYIERRAARGAVPRRRTRDRADFAEREIPEGEYFMMGDNRGQSCDSRVWGPVPRENIIGEVFAVYWPPQRIGFR